MSCFAFVSGHQLFVNTPLHEALIRNIIWQNSIGNASGWFLEVASLFHDPAKPMSIRNHPGILSDRERDDFFFEMITPNGVQRFQRVKVE
jgi:hypothetical protein